MQLRLPSKYVQEKGAGAASRPNEGGLGSSMAPRSNNSSTQCARGGGWQRNFIPFPSQRQAIVTNPATEITGTSIFLDEE